MDTGTIDEGNEEKALYHCLCRVCNQSVGHDVEDLSGTNLNPSEARKDNLVPCAVMQKLIHML